MGECPTKQSYKYNDMDVALSFPNSKMVVLWEWKGSWNSQREPWEPEQVCCGNP